MIKKKDLLFQLPENVIQFNIDIPLNNNTGLSYKETDFEYKLVDHFCNGKQLTNMEEFITVRKEFQATGKYTQATRNLNEQSTYMKFWKREEDRCLNGYSIGNDYISGYNYWYWNYYPMIRFEKGVANEVTGKVRAKRIYDFPDIYDGDYFWFHYIEEAEKRGLHAANIKARRKGYSNKSASMITRNFYLIRNSKNYAVASTWDYLDGKSGILTKVGQHLSFIDENTEWFKRRQYKDTSRWRKATFKTFLPNGATIEDGFFSEIIGIALENDPNKVRGIEAKLMIWEESGNNNILQQAFEVAKGASEEGNYIMGLNVIFGTGGSEGSNFAGLERMIRNPQEFDIYGIPNIWERGRIHQMVSYFVPDYANKAGMVDENGNSDVMQAIQFELQKRDNLKSNISLYKQHISEYPFTIEEATLNGEDSPFDIKAIAEQLAEIEVNPLYKGTALFGEMIMKSDGIVEFKINPLAVPLEKYPLDKSNSEPKGCIIIYERPYIEPKTYTTPYNLYVGGTDPVDLDTDSIASNNNRFSLAATFIVNRLTGRIVAEYVGRCRVADEYNEQLRRLLIYYNAQTLFEANLVGLYKHFDRMNSTHLLADTPLLFRDRGIARGMGGSKGIKSDSRGQVKAWCRNAINKWCIEESTDFSMIKSREEQVKKLNVHTIRSKGLLMEMKQFIKDGNFDRVDAFGYAILHMEDKIKIIIDKEKPNNQTHTQAIWGKLINDKQSRRRNVYQTEFRLKN